LGKAKQALDVVSERPTIALCAGKDCRKRCEFSKIRVALDPHCDIVEVKCVGICNGPVVVVRPASKAPIVYARVRTKKQRQQLLRVVVDNSTPPSELAKLGVDKQKQQVTLRQVRRAMHLR
jgi:(2Fe-2S) ferredoxin